MARVCMQCEHWGKHFIEHNIAAMHYVTLVWNQCGETICRFSSYWQGPCSSEPHSCRPLCGRRYSCAARVVDAWHRIHSHTCIRPAPSVRVPALFCNSSTASCSSEQVCLAGERHRRSPSPPPCPLLLPLSPPPALSLQEECVAGGDTAVGECWAHHFPLPGLLSSSEGSLYSTWSTCSLSGVTPRIHSDTVSVRLHPPLPFAQFF